MTKTIECRRCKNGFIIKEGINETIFTDSKDMFDYVSNTFEERLLFLESRGDSVWKSFQLSRIDKIEKPYNITLYFESGIEQHQSSDDFRIMMEYVAFK